MRTSTQLTPTLPRSFRAFAVAAGIVLLAGCGPPVVVTTPVPAIPTTQVARANVAGNWLYAVQNSTDGTSRRTYFALAQEGDRITGTIRTPNGAMPITESGWDSTGFTLTNVTRNGTNERRTTYEGRLVGDALHLVLRRRSAAANAPVPATPPRPPVEIVAYRAPSGEGAIPTRIALPARHTVPDNGIARTPAMGWNSWNKFAGRVDDAAVRGMADAMASNGMKEAGYVYINIDDTWEGDQRDAQGNITTNRKFPDMKALADYVHGRGLKLGIYSSPGPATCAGYVGSYGHEAQDARTFAAWGIDYLKYDWCGASMLHGSEDMPALYQIMGDALLASGRPILYSLCQYGVLDVWRWGADVGGNSWRTTGDISDRWQSMVGIGFQQGELAPYARPGHFNDPDMLEIGNGGMTDTEYRTHMSLWSMLASPLLAGNDLRSMTPAIHDILVNREVIAIDQDPLGRQASRVAGADSTREVWMRPLASGAHAVAAFNRGEEAVPMTIDFGALGIETRGATVRDLWSHRNIPLTGTTYTEVVPSHGVLLVRVGK
ncbi:MAG: glycoside hydrolase family 27 protein [Polaromonas sp.]|nr:glycoside hydrolase family 27 protein [Gemmatimonadaceae bacterium]